MLAVTVCLAAALGAHIYASNEVARAVDRGQQAVRLEHFELVGSFPIGDPTRYDFRVRLSVENPTPIPLHFTFGTVEIGFDDIALGSYSPSSPAEEVEPGDFAQFDVTLSITEGTMADLRSREEVRLFLKGGLRVSARFLWVSRVRDFPEGVDLSRTMLFD